MMARRTVLGAGLSAISALLTGCNPFASGNSIRFRLTLSVNTPSGLQTASSVLEFAREKATALLRPIDTGTNYHFGQAPALRFGERGALFALLKDPLYSRQVDEIVWQAVYGLGLDQPLSRQYISADWPEAFAELKDKEISGSVEPARYPMFVWIPDLANLPTAEEVTASSFGMIGSGISFADLTFQFVPDGTEIDLDLPDRFPSLFNLRPHAFGGPRQMGTRRTEHLARALRTTNFYVKPR